MKPLLRSFRPCGRRTSRCAAGSVSRNAIHSPIVVSYREIRKAGRVDGVKRDGVEKCSPQIFVALSRTRSAPPARRRNPSGRRTEAARERTPPASPQQRTGSDIGSQHASASPGTIRRYEPAAGSAPAAFDRPSRAASADAWVSGSYVSSRATRPGGIVSMRTVAGAFRRRERAPPSSYGASCRRLASRSASVRPVHLDVVDQRVRDPVLEVAPGRQRHRGFQALDAPLISGHPRPSRRSSACAQSVSPLSRS